ncbi:MAG: SUMF1/EgtB/PvdO family nonheme iron enzyme [Planctomycetes bacterium]|nr:SUMF1/EgtB/PvdO family nonheme iron enzyme [Planctomycetota bacterium]
MDDHRAALVRIRSRVYVRLAAEMGLVSEEDAKAVFALQEKDLAAGRASFVTRYLVEMGLLSREDADRVRERQERVSLICEKCLCVYKIEGKSPGTRLACKCGNALVVPGAGETGETVLARRAGATGGAASEGAVARLLSTRRLPPPLALPRVRAALARAGAQRYVREAPDRWLDADLGRPLAVRTLSPENAAIPAVRARFLAEARLAGQLEHPAILPVHDIFLSAEGAPCYTTPCLAGKSLEDAAPGLPLPALLRAIRRIAEALDYAHEHGVLHLAVSPRTIFLEETGAVYLLDWSSARVQARPEPESGEDSGLHPLPERPGGTPYTSPERASGKPLDRRADIYSLGATLAFGLTGKPPSRAAGVGRLSGVPRGLAAIVTKAMARKRRERYATCGELAADLARFETGEPLAARRDPLLARVVRFFRRRPRLAAALAALVAAALLGAGWFGNLAYQDAALRSARDAQEERNRARRFRENVEEAKKLAQLSRGSATPDEEAALRKALAHAQRAARIAATPAEETLASEALVRAYLGLARLAVESARAPVGPVERALEHVRAAEEAGGGMLLAEEIASVRRDAEGRVSFRVQTDPPDASVRIHRLDRESNEPGKLVADGESGDVFDLPTGGYLVLATAAGTLEVRLPVWLERATSENRDVTIPLSRDAPEGFVFIPPGHFKWREKGEWKEMTHGFYIATCELTWGEYTRFLDSLGAGAADREPEWMPTAYQKVRVRGNHAVQPDHPVYGISHDDALAYCRWMNSLESRWEYRLPESDEWEWAARGADGRAYPWGEEFVPGRANLHGIRTGVQVDRLIVPAALDRGDRSVFGCLHMAGNLSEWTGSLADPGKPDLFIVRGGTAGSPDLAGRCWFSRLVDPRHRNWGHGARLVASARTR